MFRQFIQYGFWLGVFFTLQFCFMLDVSAASPTKKQNATQTKIITAPQVMSRAALLVAPDTDRVLFAKNAYTPTYPASTTKIMTALLTLEEGNLQDVCTISQEDVNLPEDYTGWFLQAQERYTVKDLLHALLILSENPAGNTLACYVDGSYTKFAERMNKRARELGCQNTHFVNPFGRHDVQHYTTCYDLYLMAKAAMQHYVFHKIVGTCTYTLPGTSIHPAADRLLENTNLLLWDDEPYYDSRCRGIKTGYTSAAGRCIVAMASVKKQRLYVVVLGGQKVKGVDQRFVDVKNLLDYGYSVLSAQQEPAK